MGYSFNPFTATLDNTGPAQKYSEFVFNSTATQQANVYNDWADLVTTLNATEGIKRVTFTKTTPTYYGLFTELLPSGSWNLDDVVLRGTGNPALAGGIIIALDNGFSISSWSNANIEGGLGIASLSSSTIMSVTNFSMNLYDGAFLASVSALGATYFFTHSTGTLQIILNGGSALFGNGDLSGYAGTLINKTGSGTTILIAGSANASVSSNVVAGSTGTLQIIAGEASASEVVGAIQSGFSGTRDDDYLPKATNVRYTSSQTVKEALDGLDSFYSSPPTVTTKVMRLDYAGNPGTDDGAWSTNEPADLTSGVDLRAKIWFDYPSDVDPVGGTDKYQEVLSQEHPTAGGGDTFEAAIFWGSQGDSLSNGLPHTFWEAAPVGVGTDTETNAGWARAALKAREWVNLRWTQDFSTQTVKYWREVPFEINDTCEQVDGIWYYPMTTVTNVDFADIDTIATSDWWIGKRFTGYIASMKMTNFAGSTTYIDINEADLDALTVGDQTFTDDAGNTWTSTAATIVAAPQDTPTSETNYAYQDYEKTGTYVYVGYENTVDGAWYIYRRTISTNLREYATGASGYATAWTNRGSLTYA